MHPAERLRCQVALTVAPLISKPHWEVLGMIGPVIGDDSEALGWKVMISIG